jgi:hypothetical protein
MAKRKKPAVNALAPEPVNSLYNPSDLYNWLQAQESLPAWDTSGRSANPGASGSYNANTHVVIARPPEDKYARDTLTHEMTHAAQLVMSRAASILRDRQWQGEKLTPQEQQYLDGYLRLMGSLPGRMAQYNRREEDAAQAGIRAGANALGLWRYANDPRYQAYRGKVTELQAFGTGKSTYAETGTRDWPNHLDPTFATEFTILQDLYNRLPEPARKAARRQPTNAPAGALTNYPDPFAR